MVYDPYEETFRHKERKEQRRQRQIASFKDRSKFKKTDRDKLRQQRKETEAKLAKKSLLQGRVTAIKSEGVQVTLEDDRKLNCVLRGVLKKENLQKKNLVAVGDIVLIEETTNQEGVIAHIQERKSVLSRAHTHHQKQEQILAANIDQVIITLSVVIPPLRAPIADRYIIATRKGNMEPVIVINKIDLLQEEPTESEFYLEFLEAYSKAGIPVIPVSSVTEEGMESLKETMKGKSSVFAGQSGVGKSSLINAMTGLNLPVGEAVQKTRKGAHTTTTAHLIHLDFGGWCIDTPGIKSFGMWELNKEEVQEYYPEMAQLRSFCRFPNCTHTHEPDCAVIEGLKSKKIHPLRYQSYLSILESIEKDHLSR